MDLSGLSKVKFKVPESKRLTAVVKNLTDGEEKFVVARVSYEDKGLWYYGRYDYERAWEVAEEIGGIVLEEL